MKQLIFIIGYCCIACTAVAQSTRKTPAPYFTDKLFTQVSKNNLYEYKIVAKDSSDLAVNIAVKIMPAWLRFESSTNTLSGTPHETGQFVVSIEASNGMTTTTRRFMLTVTDSKTVNILPLGNSITNGTDRYNSYRRPLWQMLHNGRYNFDFIGSWDKHHMGGKVPDPDFDMDHEGHSGWKTTDMFTPPDWDKQRGNLTTWLKEYSPDIVLIELGTNDVFQCVPESDIFKNLKMIVAALREKNPSVRIVIGNIIPLGLRWSKEMYCGRSSLGETILVVNAKLPAFAKELTSPASPVSILNLFEGIDPKTQMYDDIHPNEAGEKILADKWFKAISPFIPLLK